MLELSTDTQTARREMRGLIFYLTAFGHIDGELHETEIAFIEGTIGRLVEHQVDISSEGGDPKQREELVAEETEYHLNVFQEIREEVVQMLYDSIAESESQQMFLESKLKQRCFELFDTFSAEKQQMLLDQVDELVLADGRAHPAEIKLRRELADLLELSYERPTLGTTESPPSRNDKIIEHDEPPIPASTSRATSFEAYEHHWNKSGRALRRQVKSDRQLIKDALSLLQTRRQSGWGRLKGKNRVDELAEGEPFLDGYVNVCPPKKGRRYELTVIGDLHGCYSCLKAVLLQSRFFEKLAAFRDDPLHNPDPKIILLGDYIDRGSFGFCGVMRTLLTLLKKAPDHIFILRGNHEILIEQDGAIRSAVAPAGSLEQINSLNQPALVQDYKTLFDSLPSILFFGRTLFTHGGIPRDALLRSSYKELSSLNTPMLLYQMLWSDPSVVDVIPQPLQMQSVRFGFGKLQCQDFLHHLGCHTLIRGHQVVPHGFQRQYDDEGLLFITLCSSGGNTNRDLPETSELRLVRPVAMTIHHRGDLDGESEIELWPIDFEKYNRPINNGFYRF